MRCPKCHYLSFEPEPRCKNCGYDLSFSGPDLLDRADEPSEELSDLELHQAKPEKAIPESSSENPFKWREEPAPEPESRSSQPPSPPASQPVTTELPLFVQALSSPEPERIQDAPLVKLPSVPRPPLAVRRPTPAPGRVREKYQRPIDELRQPELLEERDLLESLELQPAAPAVLDAPEPVPIPEPVNAGEESAGPFRRIEAACVDLLLIGAINFAVVWLTLQLCDLTLDQIALLPILPVAAYLFVLDSGYLLMFTATNGQTIGKMAAGIRVVGQSERSNVSERVTLKQAVLRAVLTFPSVLALGLGFVPALLGSRLALHDRFTHTRVVRA